MDVIVGHCHCFLLLLAESMRKTVDYEPFLAQRWRRFSRRDYSCTSVAVAVAVAYLFARRVARVASKAETRRGAVLAEKVVLLIAK